MPADDPAVHVPGQVAAVALPAEIDIANADAARDRLLAALGQGLDVLIADMSSTTFCDSAGVRMLVQVSQRTRAARVAFRVVVTARGVLRVLAISGADQLMDIYPDVAEAAAAPALTVPDQAQRAVTSDDTGGAGPDSGPQAQVVDPGPPVQVADEAGQAQPEPTAL
jgi:anti-sigma B factor antagonist